MVISLAAGTLLGAVNGLIITRFNVAPFIATLGMLLVARGLAGLLNGGKTFPNLVGDDELGNTGFRELGTGELARHRALGHRHHGRLRRWWRGS